MRRNGLPTLPSVPKKLGDHQERIRKLEFRKSGSGWQFDIDNEGGSGYVQFNDSVDIDTMPDPLAVGGEWGAAFEEASGQGLLIGSTTSVLLISDGTIAIHATTSPLVILVNNKLFEFRDDGTLVLDSGAVIGP